MTIAATPETGATKFFDLGTVLLGLIQAALPVAVQRACMVPGSIPWDACECGMLAISVDRIYLSDRFPEQQTEVVGSCQPAWEVAEYVVQIIRCAPVPQDNTTIYPTEQAMTTAAQTLLGDAWTVLTTTASFLCQEKDDNDLIDYVIDQQATMGPEGGCVGTELRFLVGMPRG